MDAAEAGQIVEAIGSGEEISIETRYKYIEDEIETYDYMFSDFDSLLNKDNININKA